MGARFVDFSPYCDTCELVFCSITFLDVVLAFWMWYLIRGFLFAILRHGVWINIFAINGKRPKKYQNLIYYIRFMASKAVVDYSANKSSFDDTVP